jgi:hypothetical protein
MARQTRGTYNVPIDTPYMIFVPLIAFAIFIIVFLLYYVFKKSPRALTEQELRDIEYRRGVFLIQYVVVQYNSKYLVDSCLKFVTP